MINDLKGLDLFLGLEFFINITEFGYEAPMCDNIKIPIDSSSKQQDNFQWWFEFSDLKCFS
jgi:hypothetical protein